VIRAVLFDLDGTLLDRDATVANLLDEQVQAFDVLSPADREKFKASIISLDDHGHRDKREVYTLLAPAFGLSADLVDDLVADFWVRYARYCRPCVGVMATLTTLRDRALRLGIVTNGTVAIQNGAIDAIGVRPFMDAVLISEAEGIRKPTAEIFHRAAARLRVPPAACAFVGDHPDVDVAGANAAGLVGIWKRTPYWRPATPVQTFDTFPDVLDLL
jgi:putative hydrolase of the HAD superfamily